MRYEHLQRTDEGSVATVALARPEARNALNAALISEVTDCFEELAEDEGVALRYLEINGVWEDHVRYAITTEEWEARRDELLAAWC